jgi:tetratricopeptide (TPR) repeat protein
VRRGIGGRVSGALIVLLALTAAPGLRAQAGGGGAQPDAARRAYDLERRGSYAEAAAAYRAVLAQRPGDASALFGLERSLSAINRDAEILPAARAAIAASPGTGAFYGVALRAWAAEGQADSVRVTAERWAAVAPGDEAPYREWGAAALGRHDRAEARRAYLAGRQRLDRPDALAAELAVLESEDGNWTAALHEWVAAVGKAPGYRMTAVRLLGAAPDSLRPGLLALVAREPVPAARRIESNLRARWGDPVGGFETLAASLPSDRAEAVRVLTGFLEQLRGRKEPAARRAQGLALSALADRTPGPAASRLRLDAAQAFADAGDGEAARRMLAGVTEDSAASAAAATEAATTIIGVLVKEGRPEEAERKLAELKPTLASEDWLGLRRGVAWGWVRAGNLARAESMVAGDSSVDGLAIAGRLRLFRGDVAGAVSLLRQAGPYAGTREEATTRTSILALLQPIPAESLPALGEALLAVERGDTAAGVSGLEKVAQGLPEEQGGADVRLYAGRVARAAGRTADAERLFRAADVPAAKATAPAAELALAGLLADLDRPKEAVAVLERMILGFPDSALIPQARRLLDEVRGAVPRT